MVIDGQELDRLVNNKEERLAGELRGVRVVLASKSPRRKQLLAALTQNFEILTSEADEELPRGMHPKMGVEILAVRKGEAVKAKLGNDALIISSDTLVEIDGIPLGKPTSEEDALEMLLGLQGRAHNVHTGVAVHYKGRVISSVSSASVRFREASREELWEYVLGGEPMDKAGSYGIQGEGGKFVLGYDGGFDTIMGLSVDDTARVIIEALKAGAAE